jgi:hypothetical protein
MFARTVPTAVTAATFGRSMTSACAKPMAFWQVSHLWLVFGAMFRKTSLRTKRRPWVGTTSAQSD